MLIRMYLSIVITHVRGQQRAGHNDIQTVIVKALGADYEDLRLLPSTAFIDLTITVIIGCGSEREKHHQPSSNYDDVHNDIIMMTIGP